MGELRLMKGNEAIAEAAIRCGCDAYFGYPITPQSEILEYLTLENPKKRTGMVVLQAESEIAAINMVFGAAGTGKKVMTSSSSPGISLKQEGISYIAGAEIPCLIVNVVRAGPGLGTIQPSQSDYFQATKGGGHGDYRLIVLAPASVQEMSDHVKLAFELAFKYRNPAMILSDGIIGQMMEKVELFDPIPRTTKFDQSWVTTGKTPDRKQNVVTSLELDPYRLEKHNIKLSEKYERMKEDLMWEETDMDDAELLIVAYGSAARIAQKAIDIARARGMKAGLLRPITLFPFPTEAIQKAAKKVQQILVVEMSTGQMVEDVKLAVNGEIPVDFYGRSGGVIPLPEEVYEKMQEFKLYTI
jgi:2-oxoglutarate ferredoxin oxidoreductase subunit alpha